MDPPNGQTLSSKPKMTLNSPKFNPNLVNNSNNINKNRSNDKRFLTHYNYNNNINSNNNNNNNSSNNGYISSTRSFLGGQPVVGRFIRKSGLNVLSDHHFHHNYHELPVEEEERLEKLFRELDANEDGLIDVKDLVKALETKGIKASQENIQSLIDRSDFNADGDIDFSEFVHYCLENEKQLRIIFKDIDINEDGMIDTQEVMGAFKRLGINVDNSEATKLVKSIKKEGTLEINFDEWRDYLILHPTSSLSGLMHSWRHATFVDIGEDVLVPDDFTETEMKCGMWWRHLMAGGVAGAVSRTCTAPLDRLKVFLQVRGAEFHGLGLCLKHMLQEGGWTSLWRGNGINVLKIAPESAIKFAAYEQAKRVIRGNSNRELHIYERFLAGSIAGGISQSVIYPMEVLKTRLTLRATGQYGGILDAAKKIRSQEGLRSFYKGYLPNLLGIIPYAGIDLAVYETLKKIYLRHHSIEEDPGILVLLACGTISSTCGQVTSYPLALVRTRLQAQVDKKQTMVGLFRNIWASEGFVGLYRGITPNFMKVAPAVSISYVVYENTRRALGASMS